MGNHLAVLALLTSTALLHGCAHGSGVAASSPLGGYRSMVDLTYPFDSETVYWPSDASGFEHRKLAYGETEGGYFYSSYAMAAPEHGGTHLDAPRHFAASGSTADAIPLARLIAPAVVIDLRAGAARDRDVLLSAEDIAAFEKEHGAIPSGAIVLIHTGWGSRWPDKARYLGTAKPGDTANLHFPGVSGQAAQELVKRRVGAVGIDTASIDHGPSRDFIAHQTLNGGDIPVFENVANLEKLPAIGSLVIALPMKIGEGSGAPLRIVGLLP